MQQYKNVPIPKIWGLMVGCGIFVYSKCGNSFCSQVKGIPALFLETSLTPTQHTVVESPRLEKTCKSSCPPSTNTAHIPPHFLNVTRNPLLFQMDTKTCWVQKGPSGAVHISVSGHITAAGHSPAGHRQIALTVLRRWAGELTCNDVDCAKASTPSFSQELKQAFIS